MPKDDLFTREIKHLRARGNAAYREKNDEMLLKIVNCLCKTAESQAKLNADGAGPVEIVFPSGDSAHIPREKPSSLDDPPQKGDPCA